MNEIFADREFDKMMFNVNRIPHNRSIIKAFSLMSKVPEFKKPISGGLEKNRVLRYIAFMYDKNSPFRRRFPDIMKRKIECAMHAGYKLEEGGIFSVSVEDMILGKNNAVNCIMVAFVRLHRNVKYSYLVSIEESFFFLMEEIARGEMKNLARLKEIQEEIENTILEMLNEDDNPAAKEAIFKYIEEERLNLRPEDIARKARKKENARPADTDQGEP